MNKNEHPVRRSYQQSVIHEFIHSNARFWALLWERQSGKSTTFAEFALYEMFRHKNRTVIYGSASLLLAQELPIKTAIRANQSISQAVESDAAVLKQFAETAQLTIDARGKTFPAEGTERDFHPEDSPSPLPSPAGRGGIVGRLLETAMTELSSGDQGADLKGKASPDASGMVREMINRLPRTAAKENQVIRDGIMPWRPIGDTSRFAPYLQTQKVVNSNMQFKVFDAQTEKEVSSPRSALRADDFADLFSQQRLEFRVYHDRTAYSRTKVIAPNIATARSWSGTVLLDEVAFIRNLRELITALLPVISSDKQFKLILSTTPPEFDDTHYSFELLAPPANAKFEPCASGNWYTSESGVRVHRADAFDTDLAGKKIYDLKTGEVITPAEAFTRAPNKDGHRIAHWLAWMLGGSAACDALRLRTAQERGMGTKMADGEWNMACRNFQIGSDADMTPALNWLGENIGGRATHADVSGEAPETTRAARVLPGIGIGFDVATTTKGRSNPSVLSLIEERGPEWLVRCRFIWRTADPETANQRIEAILTTLERRGVRPKALAQDATNERYYAEQNLQRFRRRLPVILVVASQSVDKPGLDKPINWKEYLGHQLVAKLDDNNLTLPPDDYTRVDYRLVMKDRGKFVCEPNDQGMHGDCFDADKLAGHALTAAASRSTIVPPMHMMYPLDPCEEERVWS